MKILLANLPHKDKFVIEGRCQRKRSVRTKNLLPPITLAYISSLLEGKAKIMVIDSDAQSLGLDDFLKRVSEYKPDYIMASVSTPTIDNDMHVLKEVKIISPKTLNVIFGIHASYFAKDLIENDSVDFVIKGEPELTAAEIPFKNPKQISGLVFKRNEKMFETKNRELLDMDNLPYPDWDKIGLEPYKVLFTNRKYLTIVFSRGCPHGCSFCTAPFYYGSKSRVRKIDSVIKEIEFMKRNYGVNEFLIYSDNFIFNKDSVKKLCRRIIEEDLEIRWMCATRVDGVDDETLEIMKKSGCWLISFGIESGSQTILNKNMKNITIEKSREAVGKAKKMGIITYGHFIFGLPGETEETIKETLDFSTSIGLDFADFYIATPFPGSKLFEDCKHLKSIDWSKFEYNTSVLDNNLKLEDFQRRAYLRFYFRPSTLFRLLRVMLKKRLRMI
ncbi:MAG: radical SAM protein [Candidatus Aenigmatarchaeota archaeon]|nr:MAG: radical SAM protein [Candidatus Aenigmarchaeota archaeon]